MTRTRSTFLALVAVLLSPMAANADPIQLLLETNADGDAGNEIYLANFDSYADLIGGNLGASSSFSQVNISSNYSVGGFTYELVSDPPASVPEPSTLALLGIGLLGMGAKRRRKKV